MNALPARCVPLPDELLSSWLVRLSARHSLKLHTFCTYLFGSRAIWNRDIDKSADVELIAALARATAMPIEKVRGATLAAYEGFVYERHSPHGNTAWLMPVGVYHRTRKLFGLQFCARCLGEDADPYYRRSWRLAFVTYCEKHRIPLHDRCARCGTGVMFWRNELGDRNKLLPDSITLCHACGVDFREVIDVPAMSSDERLLAFQAELSDITRRGWARMHGFPHIYSHLYFAVLHQLMRVLATGRRAARLREATGRECGYGEFTLSFATRNRNIESLPIGERRILLDMARHLLDDYPRRFVSICRANKVWSSELLRDLEFAPFWYWSVIHSHLYRPSYKASDEEIHSVIAYINKQGGTAYSKAISACLGLRDVFRKREYAADMQVSKQIHGRSTIKAIMIGKALGEPDF